MKNLVKYLLIFIFTFILFGCSCNKKEIISKNESINILKQANQNGNMQITTTTETNISGTKTSSIQTDIYYENKYYHISDNNGISTKTWYGEVDNVLYAFYYTKNTNNEEIKTSSRIESSMLEAAKKQPSNIVNNLFDEDGNLLEGYTISGTKSENTYEITINRYTEEERDSYTISIKDNKIMKITKTSDIVSDTIKITYDYTYDVEDITLPTFNEYPLSVNN